MLTTLLVCRDASVSQQASAAVSAAGDTRDWAGFFARSGRLPMFGKEEIANKYDNGLRLDALVYPRTACPIKALIGPELAWLSALGDYTSADAGSEIRGYHMTRAAGMQGGNDTARVWMHPDGRLVVVLADDPNVVGDSPVRVRVYASEPSLKYDPPQDVARFLAAMPSYWGEREIFTTWELASDWDERLAHACPPDEVDQQTRRYSAARKNNPVM